MAHNPETSTMIPTQILDTLEHTWNSINSLCESLTETQWKTLTQLPGWTVQDNLSHLIGTERMLQGLPATEHRATDMSFVKNPIGEFNEHEVDVRRGRSGPEVFAEWKDLSQLRVHTLRNADEAYFNQEAMTPTGPGTLTDFLHIRILDCWAHEQDMRNALRIPGNADGPGAGHTIDRLIRTIPIVVGKRAATPEGQSVVIHITGAVQRTVAVTVADGRAKIVSDVPTNPLCSLSIDSQVFYQVATGRMSGADARSHCEITGDAELAQRILDNFNMMI
jgi:uncharacterized protein (TIGR03083 family)